MNFRTIWNESRGNVIGGLIATAIVALGALFWPLLIESVIVPRYLLALFAVACTGFIVDLLIRIFKKGPVLFFEDNHYWIQREDSKDGPFCPHCWDKDHKLVREFKDETNRWYCVTHGKPRRYLRIE